MAVTRYQAGVGPDMKRCHIYVVGTDPKMSLCNKICVARDYKADLVLHHPQVCHRCASTFLRQWGALNPDQLIPTADALGVSELEL